MSFTLAGKMQKEIQDTAFCGEHSLGGKAMAKRKPLTSEKLLEYYTELQRRVSVGAYLEVQHDGSFPEDDGTPESTTLESLHNLETWAAKQGLQFVWHQDTQTYTLELTT